VEWIVRQKLNDMSGSASIRPLNDGANGQVGTLPWFQGQSLQSQEFIILHMAEA
jgi:hypothetical protein